VGGVSGNGGDKLNIELNLVPFIDLLSALVLFLLLSAVWVQISAIPTNVDMKGATPVVQNTLPSQLLGIHLTPTGIEITWPESLPQNLSLPLKIGKTAGAFDQAGLQAALETAAKAAKIPLTAVSSDDGVEYGDVVKAIDTAKAAGLETVGLTAN